jgi:hypothetical protein
MEVISAQSYNLIKIALFFIYKSIAYKKNITGKRVIFLSYIFSIEQFSMENLKPNYLENTNICSWCGQISQVIWVHGHGQCSNCGYNIDECCRGESSENNIQPESENKENS